MQAYGFSANDDVLDKLLRLNKKIADKEEKGIDIVGSWCSV